MRTSLWMKLEAALQPVIIPKETFRRSPQNV